jgi:ATP-binding cassette subfamily B protein RaxB
MTAAVQGLNLGLGRKLPMLLQTEAAECGLACIAMIAAYHGHHAPPSELRRHYGFSLRGATLKDLIGVADRLGLATRPLRLELHELRMLRLPCVLHWDLNHFVVLKAVSRSGIVIHDPAEGVRRLSMADVSRHFTGVALEATPGGGFESVAPPPRVRMRALVGRIAGLKRALGLMLCLAAVLEVFALVSPLFLGLTIDHAIISADRDLLLTLAAAFGLLVLLEAGVAALRGWMLIALGASLKVQARTNLLGHLLALPSGYFETRHVADVMSRFESQDEILQALTADLVVAILDGLMCCLTLAVMFALAPGLAGVVLVGVVLYGLLRWISYAPLRQASAEAIVWAARRDSHFLETLRGVRTVKLFNAERERRAQWLSLLVETVNRQITTQRIGLMFEAANTLILGILGIAVVYLAARLILQNVFSVGLLVAFLAYKNMFVGRITGLIDMSIELKMLGLHAERLADIALTPPETVGPPAVGAHAKSCPALELRNIAFRYGPNDPWVLDGVSLGIAPGEHVAIAGPSGCGKTTLLKVLAGLLQPTRGEILVDGEPIARLGVEGWRAMIGVVLQDDSLFAGSIGDNICFFATDPDPERIEASARAAAVHDDIARMPMGYGTLIGDMGTVLSGGQKQRVMLARALYKQPGVLLLDEATSHLDVAREKAVNEALAAFPATRIVVAHRPETIRAAERVLRLQAGRIVEDCVAGNQREEARNSDEHPPEDRGVPGSRGDHASQHGLRHLRRDRPDRLPLRSDAAGAAADGHGHPAGGAHEPLLGEYRGAVAAREDRA